MKKIVFIFVLCTSLLIGCQNDQRTHQSRYKGMATNWRAELDYQEKELEEDQYQYEYQLVISYNGELGESEEIEAINYRFELGEIGVLEDTEVFDQTQEISALYISGDNLAENSLSEKAKISVELEWNNQTERIELEHIQE
ncbi:hypothetical protein ACS127_12755 [Amphibacillus sp. Q70]|uniref:hypothetical protein n=1 Tax=Amphibacillus sp. Q70 TaxID=3453416 RepID=UPI003F86E8FD